MSISPRRLLPQRFQSIIRKRSDKPKLAPASDANASVPPVSRIPDEILVCILEIAKYLIDPSFFETGGDGFLDPLVGKFTVQRWPDLALVCRRWRTLIFNTQSFWCNIEFCTYAWSRLLIERSGSANISIAYTETPQQALTGERNEFLVDVVFDNIERTSRLCLTGLCVRELLQQPAPLARAPALEMLHLQLFELDFASSKTTFPDHFVSNISKLRSVHLSGVTVSPTSVIFSSNVTKLWLDSYNHPLVDRIPIREMVSALKKMPRLETLTIKNMLSGDSNDPISEPADLPHLTNLILHTNSLSLCCHFTYRLVLPPSTIVSCDCHCETAEDPALLVPILQCSRPFSVFRIACADSYVTLSGRISGEPDQQKPTPSTFILSLDLISLPSPHLPIATGNALNLLLESLQHVRLLTIDTCDADYDWVPVLTPFSLVEEISIRGYAWQAFTEGLASPAPDSTTAQDPSPPCPAVRKLGFIHCPKTSSDHDHDVGPEFHSKFFEALATILDARGARGSGVDEVVLDDQPIEMGELRRMKAVKRGEKWSYVRRLNLWPL
ncbi:hypothetical protein EVG20_g4470 [Dentipellis fragilis]|uniref:Uncharacterized protein n=1 Tax=Dentipellis fragilis TaxID=205917 RepID=A0A4Y9YXY4_9AGAM|nr:hypothetical protein EVG20_g4470 [Dentipellis fragilis]